jgi:predicted ester cyclase
MGIPPTGRTVAVPGLIVYRIAEGKIAEHWMHMDNMALMQQLGIASQPA